MQPALNIHPYRHIYGFYQCFDDRYIIDPGKDKMRKRRFKSQYFNVLRDIATTHTQHALFQETYPLAESYLENNRALSYMRNLSQESQDHMTHIQDGVVRL